MNHYVYRTKRGLLRTVQADTPVMAWNLARKKHSPAYLFNLSGDAWVESSWPGCVRERDADAWPEDARALYLDACASELSLSALSMLRDIAVGRPPTFSRRGRSEHGGAVRAQFALFSRGLVSDMTSAAAITDLGRASVARTGGAS